MTSKLPNYLPSTNEFAPNIIDLDFCLTAIKTSSDTNAFKETLRAKYFNESAKKRTNLKERKVQQLKLAGNVLIGLRNYKLVESDKIELTTVGNQIVGKNDKEAKKLFAKHLINNLCGNEILFAQHEGIIEKVIMRKVDEVLS